MQRVAQRKAIAAWIIMCVVMGLAAGGAWTAPAAAGNPGSDPRQEGGSLPLDGIFREASLSFSFAYPESSGWVVVQPGEREIQITGTNVAITLTWGTPQEVAESSYNYGQGVLFDYFQHNGIIMPEMPYEELVGDQSAGIADGSIQGEMKFYAAFPLGEDVFGVMDATILAGDLADSRPTLVAMIASALPDTNAAAVTVPTSINGPEDCHNVAVSIDDYSSEYGGPEYAATNLLDNNPATGWSSSGGGAVEYVVINLNGLPTVYGVLFNSYAPSPGFETDSIKDFAIEATLHDGSTQEIYKGQAALEQGYQSYLLDPVETEQVRFIFSSTHGGSYYEATDIMVCALEGAPQTSPTTGMPPLAGGNEIRQWASRAQATTQYSDDDWSAEQATGAPDTEDCGDIVTAWASRDAHGVDVLTVFFDTPVMPTRVHIYQTYHPGAITSVELVTGVADPVIPIPNSADTITGCPSVFTVDVPDGLTEGRPVIGVMIRLDQRDHDGWNEIDAVELVGTAEG